MFWREIGSGRRVVIIDERGFPAEMSVPDPRASALHKTWLSTRGDRDPVKRGRDIGQARLVARMVAERLPLAFDGEDMTALPAEMKRAVGDILPPAGPPASARLEPDW